MVSTDRVASGLLDTVPPLSCSKRVNARENLVRISTPEEHISQAPPDRQTVYKYDSSAGINQNIYILDTGVRTDHSDLPDVQWIGNFINAVSIDDHGHGNLYLG